jgi:site-specific DNA-methyltransferase (adenine-specific)
MLTNKIYVKDNVLFCKEMPYNFVDLIVTSPPYDELRDYKGFSWDFEGLAHEMYRILKPGGVLVWIVNDATNKGSESLNSYRQLLYLHDVVGFKVHDTMAYGKEDPIPMPLGMKRYANAFEYMWVFSKEFVKTFNPIMEKTKHGGASQVSGFRQGDGTVKLTKRIKISAEKVKGNIWYYGVGYNRTTTDKFAFQHPAMFPEDLASDHITSWTNPGDLVFDPFVGSGTTTKMAAKLQREWLGVDISEEYAKIARLRTQLVSTQYDMFSQPIDEQQEEQEEADAGFFD